MKLWSSLYHVSKKKLQTAVFDLSTILFYSQLLITLHSLTHYHQTTLSLNLSLVQAVDGLSVVYGCTRGKFIAQPLTAIFILVVIFHRSLTISISLCTVSYC